MMSVLSLDDPATPANPALAGTPDDDYLTWGQFAGLIRRRWLTVTIAALVGTGAAILYIRTTPKVYEASALILIDKDQYNLPEMVTHHATEEGDLSTEIEVLRSARLSQAVIQDLGLNVTAQDLQRQVKVGRGDRNANVIWLRYRSTDPALASAVPTALAQRYITDRTETAQEKVRTAVRYLTNEADTLRNQLLAADHELHDFRQQAGVVSLADEATNAVTRAGQLRASRSEIEAQRTALQHLVTAADTTATAFRRLAAFPTLITNPIVANQLRTLDDLEGQRTELLLRRTQKDPDVIALSQRIGASDAQLRSLTLTYLSGLGQQVAALDQALGAEAEVAATLPGKNMTEDQLSRKPKVLSDVYTLVETRLQEARIAESVANPGVTLIDRPQVPTTPVWPRGGLLVAVGLALGLLAGIGLAWMRERMDGAIHSRADIARAVELPVLGAVPHIKVSQSPNGDAHSVLVAAPLTSARIATGSGGRMSLRRTADEQASAGAVREAYAWLETSLAFAERGDGPHIVAFTSALPKEGKTVTASNLAVSAASHGRRVLVIDADMRRGQLHRVFGLAPVPGLADVLTGTATVTDAIVAVPVGDGSAVHVLPQGAHPPHPTALLQSPALRTLLVTLSERYDLIILDSPPVNLVSDALLISRLVEGVVVVARAGITDVAALTQATRHLREANAPVLGVLLNDINLHRDGSYDGSYRYLHQAGVYATVSDR
jgi:tyrosine-protein kinase Etk/Wzc